MPPRVRHRTAGAAVLLLAVAALATSGVSARGGVAGHATPAVASTAPAAGLCLEESDLAAVLDCVSPHTAQIVQAWNVWDGHVAGRALVDLKRDCWEQGRAALAPLGLARDDPYASPLPAPTWGPPPLVVDTDIVASTPDSDTADSDHAWIACVLKPRSAVTPDINSPIARVGPYTGTIDALIPLADRPLNLRSCYELPERLPATVSCRAWHRGEILAVRTAGADAQPSEDDRAACMATAAELLSTSDPTRGGLLAISLDVRPAADQINRLPADKTDLALLRCVVEATDGHFLTDSVIGLGDKPPPTN